MLMVMLMLALIDMNEDCLCVGYVTGWNVTVGFGLV